MKSRTSLYPQWWQPKRYRFVGRPNGSRLIVFSSRRSIRKVAKDFFGKEGFPISGKRNAQLIRVRFSEKPNDFQDFRIVRVDERHSALILGPRDKHWISRWAVSIHLEERLNKEYFSSKE